MRYGLFMHCLVMGELKQFYVEDPCVRNKYIRESIGRMAVETIHWDSIIRIAHGQWHGTSWLKLYSNDMYLGYVYFLCN